MLTRIGYFFRESLINFRRNWVMSLGAVITIYFSLLIVGASVGSGVIINEITTSVEQKVSIRIFLKDGAAPEDVNALQQQLAEDPQVKNIKYVSKAEALEQFKREMKESPEVIEQLVGNPLPASLDLELSDPREVLSVVATIKSNTLFPKVADNPADPEKSLKYGQQIVRQLFSLTRIVRIVEAVFILLLSVVSLIFINNTIRLAIYARRKEVAIMRLVGASNWFIRMPFLLEGLLQSLIGAVLAIVTLLAVQAAVIPVLKSTLRFLPIDVAESTTALVSLTLILGGMFIGLLGSGLALRRYLRV